MHSVISFKYPFFVEDPSEVLLRSFIVCSLEQLYPLSFNNAIFAYT